jgi:hypothetical protein
MNKYCETAMKKYYETVPKVLWNSNEKYYETAPIKIILWKSTLSPQSGNMTWASVRCLLGGGGGCVHNVFKEYFGLSSNCSHQWLDVLSAFLYKQMWLNGTVLDWNARDRWFKPAQFYLYFCTRKATHGLSNVTLGCVLYGTISTRVPFRPTTVQVSN